MNTPRKGPRNKGRGRENGETKGPPRGARNQRVRGTESRFRPKTGHLSPPPCRARGPLIPERGVRKVSPGNAQWWSPMPFFPPLSSFFVFSPFRTKTETQKGKKNVRMPRTGVRESGVQRDGAFVPSFPFSVFEVHSTDEARNTRLGRSVRTRERRLLLLSFVAAIVCRNVSATGSSFGVAAEP